MDLFTDATLYLSNNVLHFSYKQKNMSMDQFLLNRVVKLTIIIKKWLDIDKNVYNSATTNELTH